MRTLAIAILALFILYAVWSVKEIGDIKRDYKTYKDSVETSHVVIDTAVVAPVVADTLKK